MDGSQPKRRLTRRDFLMVTATSAGAMLIATACRDDDDVAPAVDGATPPAAAEPTPAETDEPDEEEPTPDDVAVVDDDFLSAPEPNAKRGGILRIAGFGDPAHFDLDQSPSIVNLWPQCTMYDNLVRFNPLDGGQSIIPDLATDWEISDDGLSYSFNLRDGVEFHDGTPFTSEDVVATFSRRKDPPEGVVSIRQHLYEAMEEIEAIDDLTVRFVLSAPRAYFIEAIATGWSVIFSSASLDEHDGDLRRVPDSPGTGPYRFVDYRSGEGLVVERNPDYWNPNLPYVDRIERIQIDNAKDRGTAAITGEVDMADHVSVDTHLEALQRTDTVGTILHPTTWAFTVTFNTEREPFDDPRVRKAVHLAVSRQDLARAYELSDDVRVGSRWCHPSAPEATSEEEILALPGYRQDKEEDLAEAQRLMEEAGYSDGFEALTFLQRGLSGPGIDIYAPAFQDMLRRDLKLDCVIEPVDTSVYWDVVRNGEFHLTSGVPAGAINDPSDYWGQWFKTGGPQNYAQWSNAEFDDLLDQIDQELDDDRRRELVRQAEDLLDEECPMFFHGWGNLPRIWRLDVHGLNHDMAGTYLAYRYDTVWLDR